MLSVNEFIQVDEILERHVLTYGDSGHALCRAMRIPVSLNWTFLILESDEDVVELGRRINTVVDGKDFDTFATSAPLLLATAMPPQLSAAAAIAKFVRGPSPWRWCAIATTFPALAATSGGDIPHRINTLLGKSVATQPDGGWRNIEAASNLGDRFSAVR
jgi:hypothetical protein